MAVVPFKYYMHDDYDSSERADYIGKQIGWEGTDEELSELIGRPFYEIRLDCTLDTESGAVTIVGVNK